MREKSTSFLIVMLLISMAFFSGVGTAQMKNIMINPVDVMKENNPSAVGVITKTANIPGLQNLVTVVITSPEDGAIVTDPHLVVLGYAADEAGMNYWEWEWHYKGGSYSNSSYFETAEYVEFRIDIYGLNPGWNLVIVRFKNIYGETSEDSVNVTYNPPDEEPPVVTIDSPSSGNIYGDPGITVIGAALDNIGVVSIGAKHRWKDGETETSSTIPPTTYFPFEWDFELYEGWNEISIYADDAAGNRGEDTVVFHFYPVNFNITFYQLDWHYNGEPYLTNSLWGRIDIITDPGTSTKYLNVLADAGNGPAWIVWNYPILPIDYQAPNEQAIYFNIEELGLSEGTSLEEINAIVTYDTTPLTHPPSGEYYPYPVYKKIRDAWGHTDGPTETIGKPRGHKGTTTITDVIQHKKVPGVQEDTDNCITGSYARSIKWLDNEYDLKKLPASKTAQQIYKDLKDLGIGVGTGNTDEGKMLDKKAKYLKDLDSRAETKFVDFGWMGDRPGQSNPTQAKEETPTNFEDWLKNELKTEDVELCYDSHCITITGYYKQGDKTFLKYRDDEQQGDDSSGDTAEKEGELTKDGNTWKFQGFKIDYVVSESIKKENKPPNKPAKPSGPTKGKPNNAYSYSSSTTDPDNDNIYYMFTWGDGTNSGWLGPYASGTTVTASHTWTYKGDFEIRVKAKDTHGAESEWSDVLSVSMPRAKPLLFSLLQQFFEQYLKIITTLKKIEIV